GPPRPPPGARRPAPRPRGSGAAPPPPPRRHQSVRASLRSWRPPPRLSGKIRPQQAPEPGASPREQGLDRLVRSPAPPRDVRDGEPGDVLVQEHLPVIFVEAEERRADDVGALDLLQARAAAPRRTARRRDRRSPAST